jgi:hypothetical protein
MSGAGDDWAYEHLGVFGWTTEFWDAIYHATGEHSPTDIWYVGPTPDQELAVCAWSDRHAPGSYAQWKRFNHPQLGPIEIGGANWFHIWSNAPSSMLKTEVEPHAKFAVFQALASPRLEIKALDATRRGDETWSVRVGVANTGWLSTNVTAWAHKHEIVLPAAVTLSGATVIDGSTRAKVGQLDGRVKFRVSGDAKSDGTPDRASHTWLVTGKSGDVITVRAEHQRAGSASATIVLE